MSEQIITRGDSIRQNVELQRLLTYQEAADILAVKPQTLRQWVCYKRIPRVKIGSAVRFRPTQLEEFIRNSMR
jgi:excisionase family DNA binding protein